MYKIAAVTEDGLLLSSHFGRAPQYVVFTIENDAIVGEEARPKPYHGQDHVYGQLHASGHADMFAPIRDCRVLLCGGMGTSAYQKALAAGLEVILTGGDLRGAVQAYLKDELSGDLRRIHIH